MPQDLESAEAAFLRQHDAAIRRALDEAKLREPLRHRRRRGCADRHSSRERGRRGPLPRGLEGVDRLQVVLDGDGQICGRGSHLQALRLHSESDLGMAKNRLTRRKLLAAAAPLAAAPFVGKLALDGTAEAGGHDHSSHSHARQPVSHLPGVQGHAAMIGEGVPAVGGPTDLDHLLYPPPPLPAKRGRVREYTLTAADHDLEIAPGIFFPAWTYNGTAPGPVIRATEGDT